MSDRNVVRGLIVDQVLAGASPAGHPNTLVRTQVRAQSAQVSGSATPTATANTEADD